LAGLRFTPRDWRAAVPLGEAGYLLSIPKGADLPPSVQKYLDYGAAAQIPEVYKCRVRSPWYSVPHVYQPDAFLSYMSGGVPRLVFEPVTDGAPIGDYRLYDAKTERVITEEEYIQTLRRIYNDRNPHAPVGERDFEDE
jgi:hypothetical protein